MTTPQCVVCGSGDLRPFAMSRRAGGLHVAQWECAGCRLLVSLPQVSAAVAAEYYAHDYYETQWTDPELVWRENLDTYKVREMRLLKQLCGSRFPLGRARAVDVGCGYGPLVELLRREGFEASGVEASPRAIQVCRSRGLDVLQGRAPGLPLPRETYDLVVSTHVIEHLEDPRAFVAELVSLLRPGGVIALVTDHRWTSQYSWERLRARLLLQIPPFHTSTDHTFVFAPAHLRRLLADVGCVGLREAVYAHPPAHESMHWKLYKATFRMLDRVLRWGPYQMLVGFRPPVPATL